VQRRIVTSWNGGLITLERVRVVRYDRDPRR
jgi:hypothetical protein